MARRVTKEIDAEMQHFVPPSVDLPPQAFGGLRHVRSATVPKEDTCPWASAGATLVPVSGRTIYIVNKVLLQLPAAGAVAAFYEALKQKPCDNSPSTAAQEPDEARPSKRAATAEQQANLATYYLGDDPCTGAGVWALDVHAWQGDFLQFCNTAGNVEGTAEGVHAVEASDMRAAMAVLDAEDCSLAGRAVALSQWHLNHHFCNKCGGPTIPIQAGIKRSCLSCRNRLYPRTDPVVIMLVESPDGTRALLGRSKKIRAGMYSALAGFVDQSESIEEAMQREVQEESGIEVSTVDILGSQPWPIGRGGSCELMIGGIAKATGEDINMCPDEMDDVRWFTRAELSTAVAASVAADKNPDDPFRGGGARAADGLEFFIPPPMAIAHHLIKAWVEHSTSWFPSSTSKL